MLLCVPVACCELHHTVVSYVDKILLGSILAYLRRGSSFARGAWSDEKQSGGVPRQRIDVFSDLELLRIFWGQIFGTVHKSDEK